MKTKKQERPSTRGYVLQGSKAEHQDAWQLFKLNEKGGTGQNKLSYHAKIFNLW